MSLNTGVSAMIFKRLVLINSQIKSDAFAHCGMCSLGEQRFFDLQTFR